MCKALFGSEAGFALRVGEEEETGNGTFLCSRVLFSCAQHYQAPILAHLPSPMYKVRACIVIMDCFETKCVTFSVI